MKKTKDSFLNIMVMRAIREWVKSHEGRAIFYGGFVAFDKEGDVVEDRLICFGFKSTLQISIDEFVKEFNKEEKDFVDWHEVE